MAWAKAYLRWKRDQCSGCGSSLSETTAMADGEAVHSYKVPYPTRCHSCTAINRASEEHDKKSGRHDPALFFHSERE